jgi:hypothetical protein
VFFVVHTPGATGDVGRQDSEKKLGSSEFLSQLHLVGLAILNVRLALLPNCPLSIWEDFFRHDLDSKSNVEAVLHLIAPECTS